MGDRRVERTVGSDVSSSSVVVRGDEGGLSITVDPMNTPVRKIDVYEPEVEAFIRACVGVAAEMGHVDRFILLTRAQADVAIMALEEEMDQLTPVGDEEWLGDPPGTEEVVTMGEVHDVLMEQVTEGGDG